MITLKKGNVFWVLFGFVICFDFVTKQLIRMSQPDNQVLPFLRITYIKNTGVAFGMFSDNNIVFAVLGIFVTAILLYYIYSKEFQSLSRSPSYIYYIIGLSLIASGALGNVIDRFFFGFVTDFIYFSPFPAFNVADSCITLGGITILILVILDNKTKSRKK